MKRTLLLLQIGICLLVPSCHLGRNEKPSPPLPQTKVWYDADSICTDSSPRWLPVNRASDYLNTPPGKDLSPASRAYLARRVPGGWAAGPIYHIPSANNPPTLYLRDPSQKDAALAALDTLLPADLRVLTAAKTDIVARPARWDFAELYDWSDFIGANTGRATGVSFTMWGLGFPGITVGVANIEMVPATIRWLHALHVPCRLVMVEVGRVVVLPRAVVLPRRDSTIRPPRRR